MNKILVTIVAAAVLFTAFNLPQRANADDTPQAATAASSAVAQAPHFPDRIVTRFRCWPGTEVRCLVQERHCRRIQRWPGLFGPVRDCKRWHFVSHVR